MIVFSLLGYRVYRTLQVVLAIQQSFHRAICSIRAKNNRTLFFARPSLAPSFVDKSIISDIIVPSDRM